MSHLSSCTLPSCSPCNGSAEDLWLCLEACVRKAAHSSPELSGSEAQLGTQRFFISLCDYRAGFRHRLSDSSHKTEIPFNKRALFSAPAQPPVSQLKGLF